MMIKLSIKIFSQSRPIYTIYALVLLSLFAPYCIGAEIAPEKDIIILGEEPQEPAWKSMWDQGRFHARNQQFEKAIPFYQDVLRQKPNIEEVKWELCRVYMETENFDQASLLLDSLLEVNGDRIEYLLTAGELALLTNKENQAAVYFGQALELDPGGKFYSQALQGLIDSLIRQGKRELAIPLMEQLFQSGGESPTLLLDLAEFLSQAGDLSKASYYYQELINKYRITHQVLFQASQVFEQIDEMETAAALWERYLGEGQESLLLRQKLAEYYLSQSRYQQALPHLIILLDHNINREEYLLQVGKIYLLTLGRADKALRYYENYTSEFPEGEDVASQIENIRLILANNLLSIVENDGVWILWNDLAKITPDRVGIYLAMADLLEALGKTEELMEVLQIITIHKPDDLHVRLKLSSLYFKNKSYQRCLDTLYGAVENGNLSVEYFKLRIRCELALQDDVARMASYLAYLDHFPDDTKARAEAITLSGALGDPETVWLLLEGYPTHGKRGPFGDQNLYGAVVDALMVNKLFNQADVLVTEILEQDKIDPEMYNLISRKSAQINYLLGKKFTAEQQLRISLVKNTDNLDIVLDLFGNAVDRGDRDSSLVWLTMAEAIISQEKSVSPLTEKISLFTYYKCKMYQQAGNSGLMIKEANDYLNSIKQAEEFNSYDLKIFILLFGDYYRKGSSGLYKTTLSNNAHHISNQAIVSSLELLAHPVPENERQQNWVTLFSKSSLTDCFDIYELLIALDEKDPAEMLLNTLGERMDNSVRLEIARARLHFLRGQPQKAVDGYRPLAQRFPKERYFSDQIRSIEEGDQEFNESLVMHEEEVTDEVIEKHNELRMDHQKKYSAEQQLETARTLWLTENESESLIIYKGLESSLRDQLYPVLELVRHLSDYESLSRESNWYNFLMSKNDVEILDHVMRSSFFAAHLHDDISQSFAESYEDYRWFKIVAKEREAKEALYQEKFYQAEKKYQELLEEEDIQNVNIYTDLATVYNRLGKYAKETELLEEIKEKQPYSAQLQSAVKKNIDRRRPQLFVDGLWHKEDGRGGDIDIKQQYLGLGLKIQPTLYQEAGFRAGRNIYGNSQDNSILTTNTLTGNYALFFGEDAALHARIGFEDIEEVGNAYFVYDVKLSGRLADSVEGFAKIDQWLVSDTIQSLTEGIYRRDIQAGLTIDSLNSIFFGFDVTFRDYNDDNDGKKIHLWSSYRIFSDVSSFDLTYDYEKLENQIDTDDTIFDLGDSIGLGLGYWSPGNYWKHSLTAKVKRELWPPGKRQSGNSFVSAHYGIGYEADDNFIQQFKLDILLEISSPFLLKGTFISDWSDDYDRTQAYATFVYRW